jgi:hypothetical protein
VLAVIVNLERPDPHKEIDRGRGDRALSTKREGNGGGVYWMKQTGTLDNACGLVACLHGIYNNVSSGALKGVITLDSGSPLDGFLQSVESRTPEERASKLEGFTPIHDAHISFASEGQSSVPTEQDEVKHHYVAFCVNSANELIEYDGTKNGPLLIKTDCSEGVLRGAVAEIQRRLKEGEITDSLSMMTLGASGGD